MYEMMSRQYNLLLQIEGRSGARLNRVYNIICDADNRITRAFLRIHSNRFHRTGGKLDIFEFFTMKAERIEGVEPVGRDWIKHDFNKLEDCRDALTICENNNGAMVLIIVEDPSDYIIPLFKVGFLLGPNGLDGEIPFCRWVSTYDFLSHQPEHDMNRDINHARFIDLMTANTRTIPFAKTIV